MLNRLQELIGLMLGGEVLPGFESPLTKLFNRAEGRADIEQVKIMEIPEGYQQVMPYLIVKGAARFMDFMKNVFRE